MLAGIYKGQELVAIITNNIIKQMRPCKTREDKFQFQSNVSIFTAAEFAVQFSICWVGI
jgi:hypothetical protein